MTVNKDKLSNLSLMRELINKNIQYAPRDFFLALILMTVRNITTNIGLVLIIPLLQIIGISIGETLHSGIAAYITKLLHLIHMPLNLCSILICYALTLSIVALSHCYETIITTRLQEKYSHKLRSDIYKQLLHTKWSFFIQKKLSDLLHVVTTQTQSTSICNFQLLALINKIIMVTTCIFLTALLSWKMTLLATLCASLLLCLMFPLHKLTSQSGQQVLQRNQSIFQSISEQLNALKMIKGSGAEAKFTEKTIKTSLSLEAQTKHLIKITAISKLLYACGSVIMFSVLLYIAIAVLMLPPTTLLLILMIFTRLLPTVAALQQCYQIILRLLPSYDNLKQLSLDCTRNQDSINASARDALKLNNCITIKNISFSYKPEHLPEIIQNFSLQIKKNTTTSLIGLSGAGKTTLVDLIVGLLTPTSGQIFIDEQKLDDANRHTWRQSVAYVTQNVFLFNASIRENLQLLIEQSSDECLWAVLKQASADIFVRKLEHGLDTIIGDNGVRLSGGECQRIALARALLMKPDLLVLDESTSSLDSDNIHHIQRSLASLHGKITILIISHQTIMSEFADQVITIAPGKKTSVESTGQ